MQNDAETSGKVSKATALRGRVLEKLFLPAKRKELRNREMCVHYVQILKPCDVFIGVLVIVP